MKGKCLWMVCLALVFTLGIYDLAGAKTVLTIQSGYPEIAENVYKIAAADFEKEHPDVTVKVAYYNLRDHEQKLAMQFAAGTPPDVVETSTYFIAKFLAAGMLQEAPADIVEYIEKNVMPYAAKFYKYNGKIYGMPYFIGIIALYYNKDMFIEAGLDPDRPPRTWEELIGFACRLAKYEKGRLARSGISLRLSGGGSGVAEKWWPFLIQAGGTILEKTADSKYRAGFYNQAGFDALDLYIKLLHLYKVDSYEVKHDAEAFALEQTAMFERGAWVTGYLKEHNPDLNYGIALLPQYKQRGTVTANFGFYVPQAAKNPDLAWEFIRFLQRPKYQLLMLEKSGWIPVRNDVDYSGVLKETPQLATFFETPEDYVVESYTGISPENEIMTKLAAHLVKAYRQANLLDNPEGIWKVLEQAAAEVNEILKREGLYGE